MDFLNSISTIPTEFQYTVIVLLLFYVSTSILKVSTGHIFAIIVAIIIIYKLDKDDKENTINFNEEIDYRNEMLGTPSFFYKDPNFINLFYDIINWKKLNPNNFNNAIISVNNVLQIEDDSEKPLINCVDNYQVANEQAAIAINMVHGFTYVLDNPLLIKKLKNVLKRLRELLERHITQIKKNCDNIEDKKESRDINSRFVDDTNGPFAYDPNITNFDYY